MKNQKILIGIFILLGFSLLISGGLYINEKNQREVLEQELSQIINTNIEQKLAYHALVRVDHLRDGKVLSTHSSQNTLFNTGAEMFENFAGDGTSGAVLNISLCNSTAGCETPSADASESWNAFTSCGLSSIEGTKTSNGNGNWSVNKLFTATCNDLSTNVTRIGNLSGTNFAGNSFTIINNMQTNDQANITWTIWIS